MTTTPMTRLLSAWVLVVLPLLAFAFADTLVFHISRNWADYFFFGHDLGVLVAVGGALAVLVRFTPAWAPKDVPAFSWRATAFVAALVAILAFAGAHLIFRGYPFTQDEFLAGFDANIFREGKLFAAVPEMWRPFISALQPFCIIATGDHAHWASSYLPVNAAFRALGQAVGAELLVNPLWGAVSVIAIAGIARNLWPDRPQAAFVAVALLTTSTQFLFNGMALFAMPAHLALNLVWLWCFLRGGRSGTIAALVIGFLAAGLHQLVFHLLFAAPFVLKLWVDRRGRLAGLYTATYAIISLFWVLYWTLAMRVSGFTPEPSAMGGAEWFVARVSHLFAVFDPLNVGSMAKDLARFVAWQNPLTTPLAAIAIGAGLKSGGVVRYLAGGVLLTVAAVFVLLPYQDHGWGYRYLHGQLGSICLLAAWGWVRLTEPLEERNARRATAMFAASGVIALGVLLPLRMHQVSDYVRPYVAASAAIERTDADVVLVDHLTSWYAFILVRNAPDLSNRPVVMDLQSLNVQQVQALCAHHSVAVFGPAEARASGIRYVRPDNRALRQAREALLNSLNKDRCIISKLGDGDARLPPA